MSTATAISTAPAGESLAEKNAKHFDKAVPGEWPQWVVDLQKQIVDFLESPEFPTWLGIDARDTDAGKARRLLDYACGDGLISKALKPLYGAVVGVDVSTSMLDKYRATVASLGLGPQDMIGVRGDLLADDVQPTDPPLPAADLAGFDLAATSMALHHFANPATGMQRLADRLKPGGRLLVIDWTPVDGSTPAQRAYQEEVERTGDQARIDREMATHAAAHTVSKPYGFTRKEMQELFAQAGCRDMQWKLAEELTLVEPVNAKSQVYWAMATKT